MHCGFWNAECGLSREPQRKPKEGMIKQEE